jgi:class 3 adenylate cyclase/predicted ATPase
VRCGRVLAPDVAFCTGCGAPRGDTPPAPDHHEDRRRVSVLFVDLIDFTPYVERSEPELVHQMQTRFFAAARQVIGQYGGVVEKYIGDAVMALFGAPVATETDAVRCVRAGLELQRALVGFAPSHTGAPATGLRFRVGVATGDALVDLAAARDGGQAIVAGDVVNTASRLQSVAPPGGVLVCGPTYAATKSTIRYEEQPPVTLRGRSRPTEVWLAVAPLERTHPNREVDGTPLVNRAHELSLLVNALHRALRDRMPQLVTVLGHAGIGKSRLVQELYQHSQRLLDAPAAWWTGHCPPFGENVTYAALADIVKAQAGILDTDSAETARERLVVATAKLAGEEESTRLAGALGPLVGLPGPKLAAEEYESAWRRYAVALARQQPTVLVFEDLHWADESMLRFVELLGAAARDVPLLLLCTGRPELVDRDPPWAGAITGSLTITLPPLRNPEIAKMYAHLLGQAAFPPDQLEPLVELADGNPLYAHEYTRMLIEQGALRPTYVLASTGTFPMPDSVHAVIANRVDLLDAVDRTVLQAAAVVGMVFWPGAVAAALGRPVDAVERSLHHLEQRDLIHEQPASTMAGQVEYRFGHVLVHDVCYQRLPRTERVARHDRTADWLDSMAADRATDLAEVLAHHRYTAHEIARTLGLDAGRYAPAAREALDRAARRAYALHALERAAGYVGRALGLFSGEFPERPDDQRERLRLELLATEIAFYADGNAFLTGGGEGQLAGLAERLHAAGAVGDAARAWTLLGQAALLRADRTAALSCLDRAVALFEALPDSGEKAEAYAELARLHMLDYETAPAIAAAATATSIAERLGLVEIAVNARITAGTARYVSGDRGGMAELQAAVATCRSQRLLAMQRALQNLAYAMQEEGDWAGGDELYVNEPPPDVPGGHNLTTGYSQAAVVSYWTGDWNQLLEAAEELRDDPSGEWDIQSRALCAVVRLLRGEPEACADPAEVDDILRAGRRSGFHRVEWCAIAHVALCRALFGRTGEAADLLAELAASWRTVPTIAVGEWVGAAAFAAALSGPEPAALLRDILAEVPHRTPWVEAAARTVAGAVATAAGDRARAASMHEAAAAVYAEIPSVTERMLSLALRIGAVRAAGGDLRAVEPARSEVVAFATRVGGTRLLDIAGLDVPEPAV